MPSLSVEETASRGADLPTELIELLEKIVLHNSDFSRGLLEDASLSFA